MTPRRHLQPPRPQHPFQSDPFLTWDLDDEDWAFFHRVDTGITIRFDDLCDFTIHEGGQDVDCVPVPGLTDETFDHLWYNQVLPLALSAQGELVFHASCVADGDHAIAFFGESGRGKSTLAAILARSGHPILTDDALLVRLVDGRCLAYPNRPSLRLWDDSLSEIVGPAPTLAPPVSYTDKAHVLASDTLPFCATPKPLVAACALGDGSAKDVTLSPVTGSEALATWVGHAFVADVEDTAHLQSSLHQLAGIASTVPLLALDYPRDFRYAAAVRTTILDYIKAKGLAA